jgi:YHS domain-containing protein
MRLLGSGVMSGTIVALLAVGVGADEKEFNATCPVSGQAATEKNSVNYKGKKVYFCCNNCPKKFNKNPKEFAAKANYQLMQTGQMIQLACPFTGKDCNPDTEVDVEGVKVAFCCNNCKGKFEKADDKIACVFTKVGKGFTTQTKCPVSGKAIDATKSVEHEGRKVYFCCGNCPKAFDADPEKFVKKLPPVIE